MPFGNPNESEQRDFISSFSCRSIIPRSHHPQPASSSTILTSLPWVTGTTKIESNRKRHMASVSVADRNGEGK
ncbi:hypothetical protein E2542_SST30623 [Spatholobus suberectus]|nr:hypothetical protein E2542_SST30623 [Spatholobus suberectus]